MAPERIELGLALSQLGVVTVRNRAALAQVGELHRAVGQAQIAGQTLEARALDAAASRRR